MFRDRFHLAVIIVSLCISSLGLCKQQSQPRERQSVPLVPAELLEKARLAVLWESKLALDGPERLQRLFARGDSIYGLTDRNYLFGLNKKNGRIRFGTPLVSVGLSVLGPQLFEDDLFVTAGNSLLQIDTGLGRKINLKHFAFTVTAPVVRDTRRIYVAGSDRRLHIFDANSRLEEFQVAADNDSVMTSILADDGHVVFSTQEGNIISISPVVPLRNWQFDAAGAVSAELVADGGAVFVSCQDTNLYKLDIKTGKMIWKFHTGAKLVSPARITPEVVYQRARQHGLYAIDKETGKQVWQLAEGRDVLTEANGRAYVITGDDTIVVMNNRTGKKLYSVSFAGVSVYVSGSSDSLIYIGDGVGRLACLKPTR
jgi:outer membrane protein assembly factor BamB